MQGSADQSELVGFTDYERAKRILSLGVVLAVVLTLLYSAQTTSAASFAAVAAVGLAIVGASVAVGGLLGFLFGIPRLLQDTPAPSGGDADGSRADEIRRSPYAGNTSLEQISDWLTKILVGVGLTQLIGAPAGLVALGDFLAPGLGDLPGARIFAPAIVVYAVLDGFFLSYLWTRLLLPRLFVESDLQAKLASAERRGVEQGELKALEATSKAATARGTGAAAAATLPQLQALWVDDHPKNNQNEMNLLSSLLNINFDAKTSTDEALAALRAPNQYTLVISDLSRPGDRNAGLTLLDTMRGEGLQLPYILYSGDGTAELDSRAKARGAVGSTNSPSRLVDLVSEIVQREAAKP